MIDDWSVVRTWQDKPKFLCRDSCLQIPGKKVLSWQKRRPGFSWVYLAPDPSLSDAMISGPHVQAGKMAFKLSSTEFLQTLCFSPREQ